MVDGSSAFAQFEGLASQAQEDIACWPAPAANVEISDPENSKQPRMQICTDEGITKIAPPMQHTCIKSRARIKTALFVNDRMAIYPGSFPTYAVVKLRGNQQKPLSRQPKGPKQAASVPRPLRLEIKAAAISKVQLFVSEVLKKEFYLHSSFPTYALCAAPAAKKKRKAVDKTSGAGSKKPQKRAVNKTSGAGSKKPARPARNTNDLSERYAEMIVRRATLNEMSKAIGSSVLLKQAIEALQFEIENKQPYNVGGCCGRAPSYFQMMLDTLCVNQNDGLRRLTRQDMLEIVENAAEIVSERRLNASDAAC